MIGKEQELGLRILKVIEELGSFETLSEMNQQHMNVLTESLRTYCRTNGIQADLNSLLARLSKEKLASSRFKRFCLYENEMIRVNLLEKSRRTERYAVGTGGGTIIFVPLTDVSTKIFVYQLNRRTIKDKDLKEEVLKSKKNSPFVISGCDKFLSFSAHQPAWFLQVVEKLTVEKIPVLDLVEKREAFYLSNSMSNSYLIYACKVMRNISRSKTFIEGLSCLTEHTDCEVRWEAIRTIYYLDENQGRKKLIKALEDPEPQIRNLAAKALEV